MTDDRERSHKLLHSEEETHLESPTPDGNKQPLPRRVDITDVEGTRVTPAAFEIKTNPRNGSPSMVPPRRGASNFDFRFDTRNLGCLVRGLSHRHRARCAQGVG